MEERIWKIPWDICCSLTGCREECSGAGESVINATLASNLKEAIRGLSESNLVFFLSGYSSKIFYYYPEQTALIKHIINKPNAG